MVVLTYASNKVAQYMPTAANVALQLYVLAPTPLHLFDGLVTDQLPND